MNNQTSTRRVLGSVAAIGLMTAVALPSPAADNVFVYFEDFDQTGTWPASSLNRDWDLLKSAGATVSTGAPNGWLRIDTTPNELGPGSAALVGRRRYTVGLGLIFKARVIAAYVEDVIYGDRQPRGLASGADRSNAIEFVSAYPTPNRVACRTVKNGAVTETVALIGHSVAELTNYQITARATQVDFYVNGKRVCTHTTNIPTVALNPYFATSDDGFGNVPHYVDWVSVERIM
jgi:hypothetical protein